jgi:hypothetical protein
VAANWAQYSHVAWIDNCPGENLIYERLIVIGQVKGVAWFEIMKQYESKFVFSFVENVVTAMSKISCIACFAWINCSWIVDNATVQCVLNLTFISSRLVVINWYFDVNLWNNDFWLRGRRYAGIIDDKWRSCLCPTRLDEGSYDDFIKETRLPIAKPNNKDCM